MSTSRNCLPVRLMELRGGMDVVCCLWSPAEHKPPKSCSSLPPDLFAPRAQGQFAAESKALNNMSFKEHLENARKIGESVVDNNPTACQAGGRCLRTQP